MILWDTSAGFVHQAEGVLRRGVALIRRFAEPRHSLGIIACDALPIRVRVAKGCLRADIPLIRPQAEPFGGFCNSAGRLGRPRT